MDDASDAEVEAFYEQQRTRIRQPLDEVRSQIADLLKDGRYRAVRQAYVRKLRAGGGRQDRARPAAAAGRSVAGAEARPRERSGDDRGVLRFSVLLLPARAAHAGGAATALRRQAPLVVQRPAAGQHPSGGAQGRRSRPLRRRAGQVLAVPRGALSEHEDFRRSSRPALRKAGVGSAGLPNLPGFRKIQAAGRCRYRRGAGVRHQRHSGVHD